MDNNNRTIQLMNAFFKKGRYQGKTGWYGYKIFETKAQPYYYPTPRHWKVADGEVLTLTRWEKLDKSTEKECARGVHFGTYLWVKWHGNYQNDPTYVKVFKVFVERENVDNIIVPCDLCTHEADVKVRTDRLTLVHQVV